MDRERYVERQKREMRKTGWKIEEDDNEEEDKKEVKKRSEDRRKRRRARGERRGDVRGWISERGKREKKKIKREEKEERTQSDHESTHWRSNSFSSDSCSYRGALHLCTCTSLLELRRIHSSFIPCLTRFIHTLFSCYLIKQVHVQVKVVSRLAHSY